MDGSSGRLRHLGMLELVPNDTLEFVGVEGNNVFLEIVKIHVGGIVGVRNGWIGSRYHTRPFLDVGLVDIFDHVFEFELEAGV